MHEYDVYNQWVGRHVDTDGNGAVDERTRFVHDAGQIVLQLDDADGDGLVEDDEISHRYLWGDAVDQLFTDEQVTDTAVSGEVLWPLTDNLGSIRDIAEYNAATDTTTITNHIAYDSFGQVSSETNSAVDLLFGYTGRALDEYTSLQNNLNRWYDAPTGRWISEDPIGFAAGDANISRYVGNNPTNAIDPSGLEGYPFGYSPLLTLGLERLTWENAQELERQRNTLWRNTEHMSTTQRVYVTGGTTLGSFSGVRGVSDMCSRYDAVDAHEQSVLERSLDGLFGAASLATTGFAIKGLILPPPSNLAAIEAKVIARQASPAEWAQYSRAMRMAGREIEFAGNGSFQAFNRQAVARQFYLRSGTRRVTQFYDPSKGSFPVDGRYALSSQPSLGNRIVDGITETTTFVAPQPAAKMGQFRRLMTGVGTRKNYVEFDVFPGELVSPSGTKRLLSPFQQTVSGQVDLIGRNAAYGVKGTNYLDYGFRYSVGAGAVGGGGYLTYDWWCGDE